MSDFNATARRTWANEQLGLPPRADFKGYVENLKVELEQVREAHLSLAHYGFRAIEYEAEITNLKAENEALREIMHRHQRIIALMDHDLRNAGVNFDFDSVDKRLAQIKGE